MRRPGNKPLSEPIMVSLQTHICVTRSQWVKNMNFRYHPNTCTQKSFPNEKNTFPKLTHLRPRQDGRHFPDDIFKSIFLNENTRILIKISLMFVAKDSFGNIPTLVQIMAWRRPGDKPWSEPMMANLLTHICVTRPQWVKRIYIRTLYRQTLHR